MRPPSLVALVSQRAAGVHVHRATFPWKPLSALVLSLLLAASLGASAWAQDVPAPTQGQVSGDVEGLKKRMRDLEQTVENLKKERGVASGEVAGPPTPDGPPRPTAGTSTSVPEHNRERGFLRQDAYADPQLNNAPFDPKLRGFLSSPAPRACCVSEDTHGRM